MRDREPNSGRNRLTSDQSNTLKRAVVQRGDVDALTRVYSGVEKKFALLYTEKDALSASKSSYGYKAQEKAQLEGSISQKRTELSAIEQELSRLGQLMSDGKFDEADGKVAPQQSARNQTIQSIGSSTERLQSVIASIAELAPQAARYDEVVGMIATLEQRFAAVRGALEVVMGDIDALSGKKVS